LVTVLLQGNIELDVVLFFKAFFKWCLERGGGGKVVEIYDTCFSRQKYNCGQLRATLWVFVGVMRELGTCVLHLSLIPAETLLAIIKACILHSTIIISDYWGYSIHLQ